MNIKCEKVGEGFLKNHTKISALFTLLFLQNIIFLFT